MDTSSPTPTPGIPQPTTALSNHPSSDNNPSTQLTNPSDEWRLNVLRIFHPQRELDRESLVALSRDIFIDWDQPHRKDFLVVIFQTLVRNHGFSETEVVRYLKFLRVGFEKGLYQSPIRKREIGYLFAEVAVLVKGMKGIQDLATLSGCHVANFAVIRHEFYPSINLVKKLCRFYLDNTAKLDSYIKSNDVLVGNGNGFFSGNSSYSSSATTIPGSSSSSSSALSNGSSSLESLVIAEFRKMDSLREEVKHLLLEVKDLEVDLSATEKTRDQASELYNQADLEKNQLEQDLEGLKKDFAEKKMIQEAALEKVKERLQKSLDKLGSLNQQLAQSQSSQKKLESEFSNLKAIQLCWETKNEGLKSQYELACNTRDLWFKDLTKANERLAFVESNLKKAVAQVAVGEEIAKSLKDEIEGERKKRIEAEISAGRLQAEADNRNEIERQRRAFEVEEGNRRGEMFRSEVDRLVASNAEVMASHELYQSRRIASNARVEKTLSELIAMGKQHQSDLERAAMANRTGARSGAWEVDSGGFELMDIDFRTVTGKRARKDVVDDQQEITINQSTIADNTTPTPKRTKNNHHYSSPTISHLNRLASKEIERVQQEGGLGRTIGMRSPGNIRTRRRVITEPLGGNGNGSTVNELAASGSGVPSSAVLNSSTSPIQPKYQQSSDEDTQSSIASGSSTRKGKGKGKGKGKANDEVTPSDEPGSQSKITISTSSTSLPSSSTSSSSTTPTRTTSSSGSIWTIHPPTTNVSKTNAPKSKGAQVLQEARERIGFIRGVLGIPDSSVKSDNTSSDSQ